MKKNCHNCEHLEWVGGDNGYGGYDEGFTCNKRLANEFNQDKESALLTKLKDEEYRERSKRCHEPKITEAAS